jgi:hypothetical protein
MAKPQLSEQLESLRNIGKCLEGELILTPFEQPLEEERRGDVDQSHENGK